MNDIVNKKVNRELVKTLEKLRHVKPQQANKIMKKHKMMELTG